MRLLEKCGRHMDQINYSLLTIHNHAESIRVQDILLKQVKVKRENMKKLVEELSNLHSHVYIAMFLPCLVVLIKDPYWLVLYRSMP